MRKKLFFILFMIAAASIAASAISRIVTDTIHSRILGSPRAVNVYLPKSFDTDSTRTYPILYLLHGLGGDNNDWTNNSHLWSIADQLIRSGEAEEMVIVTPDADRGLGDDLQCGYFNVPGWAYEDFFFKEFIPRIESKYRAGGSKGKRAIAGLSMGGGGTTGYAQHHPEMFAAAYPMSAVMTLEKTLTGTRDINKDDKLGRWYRSINDNDHVKFVTEADDARKEALKSVLWFVDCGDDDFLFDGNIAFYQAMRSAKIPCELRVRDGIHDWVYWELSLYDCLPFVSRAFRNGK